VTPKE